MSRSMGRRRKSVNPVTARRRSRALQLVGLLLLVLVTAVLVYKAMHVV